MCQDMGFQFGIIFSMLLQKSTSKGGAHMEEDLRQKAIHRYVNGEKPKAIYTGIGRSKKWFFKWLKRYQSGEAKWYVDQPKTPKSSPRRLPETDRQRIIATRKRLEGELFAQTGASAIKWELSKSGYQLPSDRTINRVLRQEGLVKKNSLRSQRG